MKDLYHLVLSTNDFANHLPLESAKRSMDVENSAEVQKRFLNALGDIFSAVIPTLIDTFAGCKCLDLQYFTIKNILKHISK